ncbi:MAG: winged helix-turn-helix domain-containing protein [Candidatus Acidiferrales bacterium]
MADDPHPDPRMRFGAFEVNLDERDLRRDGAKIKLNEKPFQVLAVLLERAGRVVRRDEIRSRLWPADTYVDFDANLNTALSTLRHALGDSAENPVFIQTVPRQGYRFIAPVVPSARFVPSSGAVSTPFTLSEPAIPTKAAAPNVPDQLESAGASPAFSSVPSAALVTALAATLAAFVVVFAFFYLRRGRADAAEWNAESKLLVAPFENLSGDATQDYLSDGVTEELITQLGANSPSHIAVVARSAAMPYRERHAPVEQIAEEQKAGYVVEGSLLRQQGRVHLTAQLVEAGDAKILWAQSYDRDAGELPNIEQDVAHNVTRVLDVNVFEKPSAHAFARPAHAVNADAYDHYLRGLYAMNAQKGKSRITQSVNEFQRATELDPEFPQPYVGMAQAYISAAEWSEMDSRQAYSLAKEAALKAVALDDTLPDAHMILGMELYESEWNWSGAEKEFQRALAVRPNSAHAIRNYASYLMATLRFSEAMAQFQRADEIDPDPPTTALNACMLLTLTRTFEGAIVQCRKVLDTTPDSMLAEYYLAASYVYRGCYSEALATAKKGGHTPLFRSELAIVYARKGDKAAAEKILAELQSRHDESASNYELAEIYSELGNKDDALKMLRRAFDEHSSDLLFMSQDPDFDNLRDADAYKQIVAQIGLPTAQAPEINVAQIPNANNTADK